MNNQVFQRVLDTLADRRRQNEAEEDRRRAEVIAACPEIGTLMAQRREAVMKSVYTAFAVAPEADLPQRVAAWNDRIKELLVQAGFASDYLDPVSQCPHCGDTGYTGEGKKTLCACARALYAQLMESEVGFEAEQTFERFDLNVFPDTPIDGEGTTQRQLMAAIRDLCAAYADALPYPPQRTLLLYGGSGLGKTYLLRCIHARAREKGVPALCVTANQLIRTVRRAMYSREQEDRDALYETDLLLIDDLGTEPLIEGVTVEELFNLINERQSEGLCTVLSTNLSLKELQTRYTERVISRLLDKQHCRVLRFRGKDIR